MGVETKTPFEDEDGYDEGARDGVKRRFRDSYTDRRSRRKMGVEKEEMVESTTVKI